MIQAALNNKKATKKVFLFKDAASYFGNDQTLMKEVLGGKGAGLAQMTLANCNVPPGLTITTDVCREYHANNGKMPEGLFESVLDELKKVEIDVKRKLGDTKNPLLLSVRSGAKFSMPGMMDTILNLGLNDQTAKGLAQLTNNKRFAYDSYRRFIQMFSNVVYSVSKELFEEALDDFKYERKTKVDSELTGDDLEKLTKTYKEIFLKKTGIEFPQDTSQQLLLAIEAVFKSWNNNRAIYYRNLNKIDHSIGTAVTVQSMVFGNLNDNSATGVCFTRNPSTGEKTLYGEYLINAQGEDVVAGIRTPNKVFNLQFEMKAMYDELTQTARKLETHYRDVQDIEFTIEDGKLYILQTRQAKRTAQAAIKCAYDMVAEKIITKEEALMSIEPLKLNQLLLPSFDLRQKEEAIENGRLIAAGLNASPGAAIGKIVFCPDEAEALSNKNEKVILVRHETCPDDIHGVVASQGVVTSRGGMTSHAAVVARGMGKPCVAGCESLKVDLNNHEFSVGSRTFKRGHLISIDGSTGEIFDGVIDRHEPKMTEEFSQILKWADEVKTLKIRSNADTPEDATTAIKFGAQGIGLCRTEHMFMDPKRLPQVVKMILATNIKDRQNALDKLLPMQREDFIGIFKAMDGHPVTIRLLDPPLHEFLPKVLDLIDELHELKAHSNDKGKIKETQALLERVKEMSESNPMMGLRGCRLGLIYPEINKMQVQAIFEGAIMAAKDKVKVYPEIMIPLIGHVNELKIIREQLENVAKEVMKEHNFEIEYKFGTMIEVPRACLTANEIAQYAEFFSFGTNDLTQLTFAYSRDDAEGKFLQRYLEGIEINNKREKILTDNPFEVLDQNGVGKLMKIAVEYGLQTRPDLKLGICGEHGGDPSSIKFAHNLGLNYVSCSPFRVPVARLSAAQAALMVKNQTGMNKDV